MISFTGNSLRISNEPVRRGDPVQLSNGPVRVVARNEVTDAPFAQQSAHRDSRIWQLELIDSGAIFYPNTHIKFFARYLLRWLGTVLGRTKCANFLRNLLLMTQSIRK